MHKMKLPKEAEIAAEHGVEHVYGDRQSFGLVVDIINGTQYGYMLQKKVNNYLIENWETDIQVYALNKQNPIGNLFCGFFNALELADHKGPLIACDPTSLLELKLCDNADKYFYAYDPLLYNFFDPSTQKHILSLDIITIAQTKDHAKLLKDIGFNVHDTLVRDFDIEKILEIINDSKS